MKYLDLPAECRNCKNLYIISYTYNLDENEVSVNYACIYRDNLEIGLGICDFYDPMIDMEVNLEDRKLRGV